MACSRRAHSRDDLKLDPALKLLSSSAGPRLLCPAQLGAGAQLSCEAPAMPTTSCRLTAARASARNSLGEVLFDVVSQGSEQSGYPSSPGFSFLAPSFERKSGTVGPVVARASARWVRLILGRAAA